MRLILDTAYHYVGYHGANDGDCRIRIFVPEASRRDLDEQVQDATFDPVDPQTWNDLHVEYAAPVVVVTALPCSHGTSVTNMIEYIAAEILALWAHMQFGGIECPTSYILIQENAPAEGVRNHSDYARVTFSNGVPRKTTRNCGYTMPWRWTLEGARHSYLTENDVVTIIGGAFRPYAALSHYFPVDEPRWAQIEFGNSAGLER